MTPSQYRDPQVSELLLAIAPHFRRFPSQRTLRNMGQDYAGTPTGHGSVSARIELPETARPGNLLVGVFAETIPQCGPVAFTGLPNTRSATMMLKNVPPGRWLVLAVAEHPGDDLRVPSTFSLGTVPQPVTITGNEIAPVRMWMRNLRPTDPPIAVTLAARSDQPTTPDATGTVATNHLPAAS